MEEVGNSATTLRDMRRDPFYSLKMIDQRRKCIAAAYADLGGMRGDAVEERIESSGASGGIDDIVERRLASDPLRCIRRMNSRPIAGHDGIMRHIDTVDG